MQNEKVETRVSRVYHVFLYYTFFCTDHCRLWPYDTVPDFDPFARAVPPPGAMPGAMREGRTAMQ